jgi:hypothetical protein
MGETRARKAANEKAEARKRQHRSGRHQVRAALQGAKGRVEDFETEEESLFRAHEDVQLVDVEHKD